MYYPFMLYSSIIEHRPLFRGLAGDPFIADLSPGSPLLENIDMRDQRAFQVRLETAMGGEHRWGVAAYLENRSSLLADCPQMVEQQRFIHLGLDIIVGLGTPLHAPLAAEVAESGYEAGEGNYGCFVLLRHAHPSFTPFFSFYGHLRRSSLPVPGTTVAAGGAFAEIGDFHENGNWFYHTHMQVLTEEAFACGYMSKGYCAGADLGRMHLLCPSPIPLFKKG